MVKALKRKFIFITVIYWILLFYMVAALFWWFIALNNQNNILATTSLAEINKNAKDYEQQVARVLENKKRKTTQYIGEGTTFLALILFGAVYVYRATRKQIRFSTQQQNFMMAVTHELKTPIAITILNLETLKLRKLDADKQEKLITSTLHEADRLNTLCNNILLSAQFDGGVYHSNKKLINFSEIVSNTVNVFSTRFTHHIFESSISLEIFLNGEQFLLQMLLNNLMENAVKYSPKTSKINVTLEHKNNKIILKVVDEGFGISDEEKKKVFIKFYRSGNENTRIAKGTGLGLYLCNEFAKGITE